METSSRRQDVLRGSSGSYREIVDVMIINGDAVEEVALSMFDVGLLMDIGNLNGAPGYPQISAYLIS